MPVVHRAAFRVGGRRCGAGTVVGMWSVVADLAARAHGAVSRRALLAIGVSSAEIDSFVRSGRLRRKAHGVYAVAGSPASPMQEVAVACLRSGSGARVVGARMLGQLGVRDVAPDAPWCVLVPAGRRLRAARFRWRAERFDGLGTPADIQGVASFTLARNLLEAAVDVEADVEVRVLADGVRWRAGSLRDVARLADDAPMHPGARRLRRLGVLEVDAPESEPERELEVLLAPFRPRGQVELTDSIRVDMVLRNGVVVEYQGAHHRAGHQRTKDGTREHEIRSLGCGYVEAWATDLRDPTALFGRIAHEAGRLPHGPNSATVRSSDRPAARSERSPR